MIEKMSKYERRMGLFDLFMSSVLDRQGTMDHLLIERPHPPYIISSLVGLFAVLVLPTLVYMHRSAVAPVNKDATWAIVLCLGVAFLVFTLCTTILLRILGISAPLIKVIAANVYSLTATIPLMIAYYVANFALQGEFTILSFFAHGQPAADDWLIEMFPWLVYFACLLIFLVFINAIRAVGNTPKSTAVMLSLLCLPLLVGSFTVGATLASQVFPGDAASQVWNFFPSLIEVPAGAH
jgi:hypothetical protein